MVPSFWKKPHKVYFFHGAHVHQESLEGARKIVYQNFSWKPDFLVACYYGTSSEDDEATKTANMRKFISSSRFYIWKHTKFDDISIYIVSFKKIWNTFQKIISAVESPPILD